MQVNEKIYIYVYTFTYIYIYLYLGIYIYKKNTKKDRNAFVCLPAIKKIVMKHHY